VLLKCLVLRKILLSVKRLTLSLRVGFAHGSLG
jgi:hypothetical protein